MKLKLFSYRCIVLLLFVLGVQNLVCSQEFGNEWINFSQSYYRLSIPKTGVYRVTKAELQQAGVPLSNINSLKNIQLIFKGQEIPCYVNNENSESLEYIEFYAEKNDAWFDKDMYVDAEGITNPYFSLINDTASVFFTWNNSFSNKRYKASNDQNFTGLTPISHCFVDTLQQYIWTNTGTYRSGPQPVDFEYTRAEGFYDQVQLSVNGLVKKTLGTKHVYSTNVSAKIDLAFISYSNGSYNIKVNGPGFSLDTLFKKQQTIKFSKTFSASLLEADNDISFSSFEVVGTAEAYAQASYINLHYPTTFDFENYAERTFELANGSSTKQYLFIRNFNGGTSPLLYDLTGEYRISVKNTNGIYEANIPASVNANKLVLLNESEILSVTGIHKSTFVNYANINASKIILSHPKVWGQAKAYAAYRDAYLVNVEELYNQFAYGIQKHPLAIRKFLSYANTQWAKKPDYLFIIGKGVASKLTRFNALAYAGCLVPPLGDPASDVLLSARIAGNAILSTIKTGRLSAQTNQEVADYLAKVQEFEQNEVAEWMKLGLHFGGGGNANEQALFSGYLAAYERYFSDTLFGGAVSTFLKESSDPITITKSDSIKRLINNGISIMTFFGHGSTNGFDQNIDRPEAYENKGKYPLMIANSCYSGNIFLSGKQSQSEDWVMIPEKGTIGFLAMVYEGVAYYLDLFSRDFYKQLGSAAYGETLGQQINNTRHNMLNISGDGLFKNTLHGFTLHGDPAIVLNSFEKPDLLMQSDFVQFNPVNLTSEIDSFELVISPTNIARTTSKDFVISVSRFFADGSNYDTSFIQNGLKYKDTLRIKFPIDRLKGMGANSFKVLLDPFNVVNELNEINNEITVNTFITSTDIFPTIPYNQSVVVDRSPTLKFTTGDPFAPEQTSIFEIDTTHFFNSPLLVRDELVHTGGVIEWKPSISFNEQATYFWRSAKKEGDGSALRWSESSFKLHAIEKGWQQDKAGQFKQNAVQFINLNEITGAFSYDQVPINLRVNTFGSNVFPGYYHVGFTIGNYSDYAACGANKMTVVVIDSATLIPWDTEHGNYNNVNYPKCSSRSRPDLYFNYATDAASIDNLINFVNNDVPKGNYVLIYNAGYASFNTWSESNRQGFEDWNPGSRIRFLNGGDPYILLFQQGSAAMPIELTASVNDALSMDEDLKSNFSYGSIKTKAIGPAKSWGTFENEIIKSSVADEFSYFTIYGVKNDGSETVLKDSITANQVDLSDIETQTYPYLKLGLSSSNGITKKPDQLKMWKVIYQPYSDIAINQQRGLSFYADSLQQGDVGMFKIAYENIGYEPIDSVSVKYWVQNEQNKSVEIRRVKLAPLKPNEFAYDSVNFKTITQQNSQILWVEFNPVSVNALDYDQPEQNHFNNLAHKRYFVTKDQTNPLLDVTFDGVHIMDGDIVSSTPEINIQLKDENPYIALDDTTLFSVYLKSKSTGIEQKIALANNPEINFTPAKLPENKAQMLYTTKFPEDGVYELRVQAIDPTGNESGSFDYVISFEVINESSITNVFNYPNPFSTSTQFVFELTGSEIPDEMRIDILTVTGKVVKVIYMEDLGPITIGRNISEYTWDGRDMYGDPLANGVYFYRVFARINGEEIKLRDTGTSQFFKNGFGKMYLMR